MKKILVSFRITHIKEYGEVRDCIDQNWFPFLEKCQLLPIMLPNSLPTVESLLKEMDIDGVLLTGGNTLSQYGGDAPQRDLTELYVVKHTISNKIPLLGVCRGMQVLQSHFDIPLEESPGHIKTRHELDIFPGRLTKYYNNFETVNAFHNLGTKQTNNNLTITSKSKDGVIMSVEHPSLPIYGQMWHPEREWPFCEFDIQIFKNIYGVNE